MTTYPDPDQALALLQKAARRPPGTMTVALAEADGYTLAETVTVRRPLPPFDRAMMDGYALRAAATPGRFPVREAVATGGAPARALDAGEAARILTGAALPAGADTVVEQEAVRLEPGEPPVAVVERPVAPGRNVGPRGSELGAGAVALGPGERLGPLELGLLAALGRDRVAVARPPRVALVVTGDEVVPPGREPAPDGIWDANTTLFTALIRRYGGTVVSAAAAGDDPGAVTAALDAAAASGADLILTTGGVSVGDRDFVIDRLRQAGELLFWRLDLHPGKSAAGAVWRGTPVLALSGNPGAALMGWFLVGARLLVTLQGGELAFSTGQARLTTDFPKPTRETRYLRVRIRAGGAGLEADPGLPQGSDLLTAYHLLDALAVLPAQSPPLKAGTAVRVLWIPGLGREAPVWHAPAAGGAPV